MLSTEEEILQNVTPLLHSLILDKGTRTAAMPFPETEEKRKEVMCW